MLGRAVPPRVLAWFVGALCVTGCGNSQKCMPGETQACLGPGACSGAQACAAKGDSWETCTCGTGSTGGTGGGGGEGTGGGGADGGDSSDGGHGPGGGGQSRDGGTGGGGGGAHTGGGAGGGAASPCLSNNGGCAADATCTSLGGEAACACNPRFTGDGRTCLWNDPTLSGLTIEPGTLAFKASTTLYAVDLPAATYSVIVTPTVALPGRATVTVNQQPLETNGTATVVLGAAATLSMPVLVTTESGAQKSYTVLLLRGFGLQAYAKAFNTDPNDYFGTAVALSGDGSTLAVGACNESSSASGVNASTDGGDHSAPLSGAVYVFARSGTQWAQEAYVKASHPGPSDLFGYSVALSTDGNTLAVGAKGEDSKATSINGDETDNSAPSSGAVYVFGRSGTDWVQRAYVKASNTGSYDAFGTCVALNADGTTLAVGARGESSSATGVGGNESDNDAGLSGAAYVFTFDGTYWSQQAYLKASNTDGGDELGSSIALASDGNTLAVGAPGEASNAKGVDGSQTDNSAPFSGAVYVFLRNGVKWAQQAYLKASNTEANDQFGFSLALSGDGDTLAVGAKSESSAGTGVGSSQSNNDAGTSGAVYVFSRSDAGWAPQAYVKASNTGVQDWFGYSVALSSDGVTLAVGAINEASNATGAWGTATDGGFSAQANDSAPSAGAVYVFWRGTGSWAQLSYVKASNTNAYDFFGTSVALSSNGATLAASAPYEDSSAQGVGGDQADNDAGSSGAVYVFSR